MKILVLNGSPKREHSDTMHITRAFLDGMSEAAHQDIHVIHVIDRNSARAAFPVCETAGPVSMMTICGRFWTRSCQATC